MFRFENLDIWRESLAYANTIYDLTQSFPKEERYGLVSQLRRSAVSISANIAEGAAAVSHNEFRLFINYSTRSLSENISELHIARDRGHIGNADFLIIYNKAEALIKRITAFKKSLR